MKKDNCQNCGISKNDSVEVVEGLKYTGLIIHHLIPRNKKGSDEKENLITLCHKCHRRVHTIDGKLNYSEVDLDITNMFKKKNL